MRSKCALYVDAGYLLASLATRATGTSLRNGIHVEYPKLIRGLIDQAEEQSGVPVLRVHWYDSAKDGVPDLQQERIGELPRVKLRLGRFGFDGQQKGVDVRMGLDLVAHARNSTVDVFFLISGDDDLTEAVEEAQVHGVQVIVLAVPNADGKPHGVSRHLLRAADELVMMAPETADAAVMRVEAPEERVAPAPGPVPATPPAAAAGRAAAPQRATIPTPADLMHRPARHVLSPAHIPATASVLAYRGETGGVSRVFTESLYPVEVPDAEAQIDTVARRVLTSLQASATPEYLAVLLAGKPSIPASVDRALLMDLSEALQVFDLSDSIRFRLRDRFWELLDEAS
jgi:uncharacterized LabA/DUF88 family protein